MIKHLLRAFAFSMLFTLTTSAYAQSNATLKGVIKDDLSGETLIGATVEILETNLNTVTDLDGQYRITSINPGAYKVEIRYLGYISKTMDVDLVSGVEEVLNVSMQYESVLADEVVISAQAEGQISSINQQLADNTIKNIVSAKKIQETPDLLFNNLLSWLFIQQKEYYKAFTQEKAIFKRNPESLSRIENVAVIATNENQDDIAIEIFEYIVEIAQDPEITLKAENNILKIETKKLTKSKEDVYNLQVSPNHKKITYQVGRGDLMIADYNRTDTSKFDVKTEALNKIWQDQENFSKRIDDLTKASAHLQQVAASGDKAAIKKAIVGVGKTCGGCHDDFKKD